MADFKRIIQRTTNSERVETGVADLQPNEICIVEDGEELIYKDRNGKYISVSRDKYKVDTIEELKRSKKYKVGDIVEVLGYYTPGDGGGHPRKKMPQSYVGNDAIIGADGSVWGIVHNGEISSSWFGNEVSKLLDFIDSIKILNVDKDIEISSNLNMNKGMILKGKGKIILSNMSSIIINDNTNIFVDLHVNNPTKIRHWYVISSMDGISTSVINPKKSNIVIKNKITGNCEMGIYLHNSEFFEIDVDIEHSMYAGIHLIGCRNGDVKFILRDLGLKNQTSELSYGITASLSKYADVYKVTGRTTNVTVRNSIVHNGDNWNAFDTHGGKGITFVNCKSFGVGYPMGIVDVQIDDGTLVYPEDIIVDNCYLESIKDMEYLEQKVYGVALKGNNVKFVNNTIKYGGNQREKHDSIGSFGLRLSDLTNSLVADNTIIECSNNGIGVLSNVSKTKIYGNTVIDPYSENINPVSGVFFNGVSADDYSLEVYDNTVIRTTKQFPINMTRVFYNNSYKVNSFYNNKLINLSSENLSLKWEAGEGKLGRDKLINKLRGDDSWGNPSYFSLVAVDKDNISFNNQLNNNFSRIWYSLNQIIDALDKQNLGSILQAPSNFTEYQFLDTPDYIKKMKENGIYEDFELYMNSKFEYDSRRLELEEKMKTTFEQRENKEQTYNEWLSQQPMILLNENEPQPSIALQNFKKQNLG